MNIKMREEFLTPRERKMRKSKGTVSTFIYTGIYQIFELCGWVRIVDDTRASEWAFEKNMEELYNGLHFKFQKLDDFIYKRKHNR